MWTKLNFKEFEQTKDYLHMCMQIVGKFRLKNTPWINHSWHVPLYVGVNGFTTSLVHTDNISYEVVFNMISHRLDIHCSNGQSESFALERQSVSEFYNKFEKALNTLGYQLEIHQFPNEVVDPIPFKNQKEICQYNKEEAHNFWIALVSIDKVFQKFRAKFNGKVSPIHFFWGSFDLALTRFSGREAPEHPGGFPSLPDWITKEAYSHEVSSCGFWPGGGGIDEAAFYSYAYPTPAGFKDFKISPQEGYYHKKLQEFVLHYDDVRQAHDPEEMLLSFLQTTYEAAHINADWPVK